MPEVYFEVRWPDGRRERYYSPSRAVRTQLEQGRAYRTPEFIEHVESAMLVASERVRAKYGYACSSAADTLARIRAQAQELPSTLREHGEVVVLHLDDPG